MAECDMRTQELVLNCGKKICAKTNPQHAYEIDRNASVVGSFSSFYKASRCGHKKSAVTFKVFDTQESPHDSFLNEVSALVALGEHPNIVPFLEVFTIPCDGNDIISSCTQYAICLDYSCGMDLLSAMSKKVFSEKDSRDVMIQVLRALRHIHEHGYIHCDVTPENVLVTSDGGAVLADFGRCVVASDCMDFKPKLGSPGYVAPEFWLGEKFTPKADIFSAGVMLHFIVSGKASLPGSNLPLILRRQIRNNPLLNKMPRIDDMSSACRSVADALVQKDLASRPTAQLALDFEWFSQPLLFEDCKANCDSVSTCSTDDCHASTSRFVSEQSCFSPCSQDSLADLFRHPFEQYIDQSTSYSCNNSSASSHTSVFSPCAPSAQQGKKPFFARKRQLLLNCSKPIAASH